MLISEPFETVKVKTERYTEREVLIRLLEWLIVNHPVKSERANALKLLKNTIGN